MIAGLDNFDGEETNGEDNEGQFLEADKSMVETRMRLDLAVLVLTNRHGNYSARD